jgi:Na+/H+ antiporter NhaA
LQNTYTVICKNYVLIKGNPYRFSILKNKFFYELLLNEKFTKPIGFNSWNTYLQKELPKCETVCYFIFQAKIGILTASLFAGLFGYFWLRCVAKNSNP